jgi:hypothetical protein
MHAFHTNHQKDRSLPYSSPPSHKFALTWARLMAFSAAARLTLKGRLLRALREQIVVLHRRLLAIVRDDEVCRRLMTTPVSAQSWR